MTDMRGTIIKALAGFYYVDTPSGVYMSRARGIFKNEGIKPLVGDDVDIEITHEQDMEAVINVIHERNNSFIRPPIANVGQFAIIVAAVKPLPNTDILDKFLVNAERAGTKIIICINKIDIDKKGNVVNQLKKCKVTGISHYDLIAELK
jgi:ribosome biogenesis GTPase